MLRRHVKPLLGLTVDFPAPVPPMTLNCAALVIYSLQINCQTHAKGVSEPLRAMNVKD